MRTKHRLHFFTILLAMVSFAIMFAASAETLTVVSSITALKALNKNLQTHAFVSGYNVKGDGGGGTYYYDAADTTSTDNGGTIFVATDGGRWKLVVANRISARQFGIMGVNNVIDSSTRHQAFLDICAALGKTAYYPAGNYTLGASLCIPNFSSIEGEDSSNTIFNNQWTTLNVPQFVNKDSGTFYFVNISNITLRGGTYGIDINVTNGEQDLNLNKVNFQLQSIGGLRCNKLFQCNLLSNVSFYACGKGIEVSNWTTNMNTFINCQFLSLTGTAVYFRSSEVNNFIACHFEGFSGTSPAIDVSDNRELLFAGCYFEGTQPELLREISSYDGITFSDCHFTNSNTSGKLKINSNGKVTIQGGDSYAGIDDTSTARIISARGAKLNCNIGLTSVDTANRQSFASAGISLPSTPSSQSIKLAHFKRPITDNSSQDCSMYSGTLTIRFNGLLPGGFNRYSISEYKTCVLHQGANYMSAIIGTPTVLGSGGLPTFAVRFSGTSASEGDLWLDISNYPSNYTASLLGWSFDGSGNATTGYKALYAELP